MKVSSNQNWIREVLFLVQENSSRNTTITKPTKKPILYSHLWNVGSNKTWPRQRKNSCYLSKPASKTLAPNTSVIFSRSIKRRRRFRVRCKIILSKTSSEQINIKIKNHKYKWCHRHLKVACSNTWRVTVQNEYPIII